LAVTADAVERWLFDNGYLYEVDTKLLAGTSSDTTSMAQSSPPLGPSSSPPLGPISSSPPLTATSSPATMARASSTPHSNTLTAPVTPVRSSSESTVVSMSPVPPSSSSSSMPPLSLGSAAVAIDDGRGDSKEREVKEGKDEKGPPTTTATGISVLGAPATLGRTASGTTDTTSSVPSGVHASPGGAAAVQLIRSQSADNMSRDRTRRERVRREREVKQTDGERMFLERSLPPQHPGIGIYSYLLLCCILL
jgi:hypothetical protein